MSGERDVPYQWQAGAKLAAPLVNSAPPRQKRFALPLHVSIWPFKVKAAASAPTSKKKVRNPDSLTS
jgi:hypothetical protein